MVELGQSEDPRQLVPGDVQGLHAAAKNWVGRAEAMATLRSGLKRLPTAEHWSGEGYRAYEAKLEQLLAWWVKAEPALREAAAQLEEHASMVALAQDDAAEAVRVWNTAPAASHAAWQAYQGQVAAEKEWFAQNVGPVRGYQPVIEFIDPAEAIQAEARMILAKARNSVRVSGDDTARAVQSASEAATTEPDFWKVLGVTAAVAGEVLGRQLQDRVADTGNALASMGKALIDHPDIVVEALAGVGLTLLGGVGEAGGAVLDATGVGAVGGVPLNIVSAGAIAAGAGILGHAGARVLTEANGNSRTEPFQKSKGVDRGDGRDDYGKWTKENHDVAEWIDKEKQGLDEVEVERGVEINRKQVRATVEGGNPNGRLYDGLFKNADGTYTGVEVKSGGGDLSKSQKLFDGIVNDGKPASAKLNGKLIQITKVIRKDVE